MPTPPKSCHGCRVRYVGCHAVCPTGIAQDQEMRERSARATAISDAYYRFNPRVNRARDRAKCDTKRSSGIKLVRPAVDSSAEPFRSGKEGNDHDD